MGRYYHNQDGEEGKFWFGVQPSDDPVTVFGGTDVTDTDDEDYDEDYADFDIDDEEYVAKKLNEQYDILGVPTEKRRFDVDVDKRSDYIWNELFDYIFSYEKPEKYDGIPYGDFKDGKHITYYALSREKELAASRVSLGLFILGTIKRHGSCFMTANM